MGNTGFEQVLMLYGVVRGQRLIESRCISNNVIVAALGGKIAAIHINDRSAQVLEPLPLQDPAPSSLAGLDGIIDCGEHRSRARRGAQIVLHVVSTSGHRQAQSDREFAAMSS